MATRPYPYASLPKLTRRQRQLLTAVRTYWDETKATQALQAARSLLGHELAVRIGIGDGCSAQQLAARCTQSPGVAVLIEQAHHARPLTCTVELTYHAAQQLVDLALGGDSTDVLPTHLLPLDELSRGALAYLIARVLASLSDHWTLRDIAELSQLEKQLIEDCVVYPIALTLGQVTLTLRAYIPERICVQDLPERIAIRSLHGLRVTLCADAGCARLPLQSARELELGDVIVLDLTALVRNHGAWRGQVRAGLLGSRNQIECEIEPDGLRVLNFMYGKEHAMSTGHVDKSANAAGPSDFATDTPIELQVEIARFSLSLGELQRMQTGDVLVTGRRIGDRVSVRVAGQTFAEGELVDVEGEVGVRLLSFCDRTAAATDHSPDRSAGD